MNDIINPDAGISSTSDRPPEPILSITNHYSDPHIFRAGHHFCLIITGKIVICVNTDELLAARKRDTLNGKIPAHAGPLGYFLVALSLSDGDVDFSEHFSKMDPSRIIEEHPDAETIMLKDVVSFAIWLEPSSPIDTGFNFQWVVKVTGLNRRIELFSIHQPMEILENERLKALLGDRFIQPKTDFFGTLLSGRKLD